MYFKRSVYFYNSSNLVKFPMDSGMIPFNLQFFKFLFIYLKTIFRYFFLCILYHLYLEILYENNKNINKNFFILQFS